MSYRLGGRGGRCSCRHRLVRRRRRGCSFGRVRFRRSTRSRSSTRLRWSSNHSVGVKSEGRNGLRCGGGDRGVLGGLILNKASHFVGAAPVVTLVPIITFSASLGGTPAKTESTRVEMGLILLNVVTCLGSDLIYSITL